MDTPFSGKVGPPRWRFAEESAMKGWFRLRISNFNGHSHWSAVLPQMKTPEGRKNLKNQIKNMVKYVQSSPKMNDHIVAWYGYPEELIKRSSTGISEQRVYLKLVHDVIKAADQKKRPLYVSERSDSSQYNMIGNSCFQDGSLKQNFLIASNAYGGDNDMRFLMWQWARDQVITAEKADKSCPSYTGRKRAAISTLAMFRDPKDPSKCNEEWLRRIITHDIYIQLAAGISGFSLYTWSRNSSYSQKTKSMQEKIYTDVLGNIAKSNLGKVFLWGDDRDDIKMEIISGPDTVKWKKYRKWFAAPSIQMRNIQYGKKRYILLVNSSKETINTSLSGFPSGMMIVDMIQNKWNKLESSLEYTLQPNDVRMHKIANMSEH